jgi:hypothetical protein
MTRRGAGEDGRGGAKKLNRHRLSLDRMTPIGKAGAGPEPVIQLQSSSVFV